MNTAWIRKILEAQKIHQVGLDMRRRGHIQDRNNPQLRDLSWKAGSMILDLHGWLTEALDEIDRLRAQIADPNPETAEALTEAQQAADDLCSLGVWYENRIEQVSRVAFQARAALLHTMKLLGGTGE